MTTKRSIAGGSTKAMELLKAIREAREANVNEIMDSLAELHPIDDDALTE